MSEDSSSEVSDEGSDEDELLLPLALSPYAPPDPELERRTTLRLQGMSNNQLRQRRDRIDKRLFELGFSLGEPALEIPSVRGTGLVDLDRILRKLDRLSEAREQARMERELDGKEEAGLLSRFDLSWLSDAFRNREIRARRQLLISELGLALCAADQQVLGEYAPHIKRLLQRHVKRAQRVDELFVEMRLVDEELERRAREGLDSDPPKEIDLLLSKALDSVDEVGSKVGGTLVDFGRNAAKNAVSGGGQAALALAKGAALGALSLGKRGAGEEPVEDSAEEPEAADPPAKPKLLSLLPRRPDPATEPEPAAADIPQLIRDLARLRDEGILDESEFRAKKRELLDRL
ncbi:MAG TPA: hypothetical protein DEA08_24865 [Planctomycetes bacterium]|nr:hypothetical protein [Planctomycetota bacterium]